MRLACLFRGSPSLVFLALFLSASLLPLQFAHAAPELNREVAEILIPKLNSDRISYFFENFGVDPISIDSLPLRELRISNLYSVHQGQKFMRTLAVVQFDQPIHEELQQAHQEISKGASIGIALRQNGWKLDKVPLYFGSVSLSPQVRSWMREGTSDPAALHIYKLVAFKSQETDRIPYCTIAEIHSPQYLDRAWLQALYPEQYRDFQKESQEVKQLLGMIYALIEQFP